MLGNIWPSSQKPPAQPTLFFQLFFFNYAFVGDVFRLATSICSFDFADNSVLLFLSLPPLSLVALSFVLLLYNIVSVHFYVCLLFLC
eukprot:m.273900 g.273900  ORF g.273900 m.273900 type:complete len:87 (-) comp96733_c0_seq1:22-282(-)